MKTLAASALALSFALSFALPAMAGTVAVDPSALESKTVHDAGQMTALALSADGSPAVALLDVASGNVVAPHSADSGLRLITVVSGTLYWGDGDTVDPAAETAYPAGSLLLLQPGQMHWVAARDGDLRLELVVLDDEVPVPAVAALAN